MAMEGREAWPEFADLWEKLRREWNAPGTVLLVEGEKDRRSVAGLGVVAPIRVVHDGESLSALANSIAGESRRVVVLTDWDAAGGRLARRLRELLSDGRVEVDLEARRRLSLALRAEVVHVEGLRGWAERRLALLGLSLEEWLARTA
jgi:5S rRNA maturation endonuclease (ribonuclease M5)